MFDSIADWFLRSKREFPWRENVSPYKVLVSEIMLQQTRACVVMEYFERWMRLFPDIEALAASPLEKVIKAWEGLGYYSRARNLHAAAKHVMDRYQGVIPDTRKELEEIPGIGPYTAGAILSFAYHKKSAAIDGNVLRVLSRVTAYDKDIGKASTRKHFQTLLETHLSDKQCWIEMEGLIELGATICQKKPACHICPMKSSCAAYKMSAQEAYPISSKKYEMIKISRDVFCVFHDTRVLVKRNPPGQIMADLWEFPYSEEGSLFDVKGIYMGDLDKVVHYYTKYQVSLFPRIYQLKTVESFPDYNWIELEDLEKLSFSSGHKKIMQLLLSSRYIKTHPSRSFHK